MYYGHHLKFFLFTEVNFVGFYSVVTCAALNSLGMANVSPRLVGNMSMWLVTV